MKLAFCLEMLYTEFPFVERLTQGKKDGISQFEFWDWRNKDLKSLRKQMTRLKMNVSNISGNRKYGMIDPADRSSFLNEVRETATIARSLDCPRLMLLAQSLEPDGKAVIVPGNLTAFDKIDNIISCGHDLAKIADELNIDFVIEPLNTTVDHPHYFLNASQMAFNIIEEIDHPRIKLLYDIYHMGVMNEDILVDLEENIDNIGYIHVADKPGRNEPGSGEIDYPEVFVLLKRLEYNSVVGFEFLPTHANSKNAVHKTFAIFS